MAIKVNGTTVINDSRALQNIASVDSTTATAIGNAGVGGSLEFLTDTNISSNLSYVQYTFPTGYKGFLFELYSWFTTRSNSNDYIRMRYLNSSGSLDSSSSYMYRLPSQLLSGENSIRVGHLSTQAYTTSYSGNCRVLIMSPLQTDTSTAGYAQDMTRGVEYNSTAYFSNSIWQLHGYYTNAKHNGVRFYSEDGYNIGSSSGGYRVWGIK